MSLTIGGVVFPLAASTDLLAAGQPFAFKALAYYQACLNAYLEAAYVAAMPGKAAGQPGTRACIDTGCVDPSQRLVRAGAARTPYLAVYADRGNFDRHSLQWDQVTTIYQLAYVLEPMDIHEMQHMAAPFLSVALKLLAQVTENQSDPNYNAGERVWDTAGTKSVTFGAWKIVPEQYSNTSDAFPALRAEITVVEREAPDANQGGPYVGTSGAIDIPDTENGGPIYPDLVDFNTDVPNPVG